MTDLILAILTSGMVSIAMRLSEKRTCGSLYKLAMNYLLCAVCGGAALAMGGTGGSGAGSAAGMGLTAGVLALASLWMMQRSVEENGVVLSATFMKLGLLVPMALSLLLFRETPSLLQGIGVVLALAAIVLIHYEKGQVFGSRRDLLLLLVIDGMGLAMSKIFGEFGVPEQEDLYLLCTFLMALVLSVLMAVRKKEKLGWWQVFYGLLIGLPNYFSFKFVLRALDALPAVVVYPTYSVGSLLVVTLAGVLAFREKLSRRQLFSVAVILAALALLNL